MNIPSLDCNISAYDYTRCTSESSCPINRDIFRKMGCCSSIKDQDLFAYQYLCGGSECLYSNYSRMCKLGEVKKNESFITPEAIMVVTDNIDDVTIAMHEFTLKHIVRPTYQNKIRPIIFNSWEGSTFRINEDSLLEIKGAKVYHKCYLSKQAVDLIAQKHIELTNCRNFDFFKFLLIKLNLFFNIS